MKTIAKLGVFAGLGLIIAGFVLGVRPTDLKGYYIEDDKYIKNQIEISENVSNIYLNSTDRNYEIYKTDGNSYLEYYIYTEKEKLSSNTLDDEFSFNLTRDKKRYDFFNIKYTSRTVKTVKVYLNKDMENIKIDSIVGGLIIEDLVLTNLDIKLTTGNVSLKNISVLNDLNVKLTTGNINLNKITANKIKLNSTTGSIRLYDINTPLLDVKTTTGNIRLEESKLDIGYFLETKTGNINLNGESLKNKADDKTTYETYYTLITKTGNININN